MAAIRAVVGSYLAIERADLPRRIERALTDAMTFDNPAHTQAKRHGSGFTDEPEFLYAYELTQNDRWLKMPRGMVPRLSQLARGFGAHVAWDTRQIVTRTTGLLPAETVDPDLRDYQITAATELIKSVQGVIQIPTGGGKTRTMSAALVATGEPFIVFCHTRDIFDQWIGAFDRLGVTVRKVRGHRSNWRALAPGQGAVAMIPSVHRNLSKAQPLLMSAGAVAFDETHHLPAETWSEVSHLPARYRWGCTATLEREDGLEKLLHVHIGAVVFKVSERELIKRGFLAAPTVLPVMSGWSAGPEYYEALVTCSACQLENKPKWEDYMDLRAVCVQCHRPLDPDVCSYEAGRLNYSRAQTDSMRDPAVLEMICDLVQTGVDLGRTVLVLMPRKSAVFDLNDRLRGRGIASVGVTNGTGKRARREALNRVRRRDCVALVATTLADEGLDIPILDMGINCHSGKARARGKQRMGRLLRLKGQDPWMFELVHDAGAFIHQWHRRSTAYMGAYGPRCIRSHRPVDPATATELLLASTSPAQMAASG